MLTLAVIERNGHELTLNLPSKPIYVYADVVRLAQVFSNLLSNAAKYGKGTQERGQYLDDGRECRPSASW